MYYISLDPELRRWLSLPDPYHRSHARYFVDRIALATAREGQGADFAIEDRDTEIGIGWIGFRRGNDNEYACGFWLAADARGRGLMTQALRTACRWAMTAAPEGLGAHEIHWEAHEGNHASRAVAVHAGFIVEPDTVPSPTGPKWTGRLLA